jgi:Dirigent-like protein
MRNSARWAIALIPMTALAVYGTVSVASAAPASPVHAARTLKYYGFDINNGSTDPGFIPVAGTNPQVFAQGDELIINDQLTGTHRTASGYPIVGYDAGVCTLTRVPEQNAPQTLANCVVTAVVKGGSITVQGVIRFKSQQPAPAVLAVTGGTGRFDGAAGTVRVSFTKDFKILSFALR